MSVKVLTLYYFAQYPICYHTITCLFNDLSLVSSCRWWLDIGGLATLPLCIVQAVVCQTSLGRQSNSRQRNWRFFLKDILISYTLSAHASRVADDTIRRRRSAEHKVSVTVPTKPVPSILSTSIGEIKQSAATNSLTKVKFNDDKADAMIAYSSYPRTQPSLSR